MDRSERFLRITQLLHERTVVPRAAFLDDLEVSHATFKRDLEYMRDRYNAPIVWDADAGGYRFDKQGEGPKFELPGLWFNEGEVHALLMMEHLLASLDQGGFIGKHVEPLRTRLSAILDSGKQAPDDIRARVRLLAFSPRKVPLEHFETIGLATLKRKRIAIRYYARSKDETSEREVSPQRLVHYRGNWYLDAWCHKRDDLRTFAIDGVRDAKALESDAADVPHETLEGYLATGYGIVRADGEVQWAKLRFTAERARWVASEVWHPEQRGKLEPNGRYTLEVPYRDDRELLLEILKHAGAVEVLEPEALRTRVREAHVAAAERNA
ncbi:MAG: YafY family protein [Burkholderiales bacterium]